MSAFFICKNNVRTIEFCHRKTQNFFISLHNNFHSKCFQNTDEFF